MSSERVTIDTPLAEGVDTLIQDALGQTADTVKARSPMALRQAKNAVRVWVVSALTERLNEGGIAETDLLMFSLGGKETADFEKILRVPLELRSPVDKQLLYFLRRQLGTRAVNYVVDRVVADFRDSGWVN